MYVLLFCTNEGLVTGHTPSGDASHHCTFFFWKRRSVTSVRPSFLSLLYFFKKWESLLLFLSKLQTLVMQSLETQNLLLFFVLGNICCFLGGGKGYVHLRFFLHIIIIFFQRINCCFLPKNFFGNIFLSSFEVKGTFAWRDAKTKVWQNEKKCIFLLFAQHFSTKIFF